MARFVQQAGVTPVGSSGSDAEADARPDCRSCVLRARCISYGWMSPGGLWFENAVVLRPTPGCRGYEGRSADIFGHFPGDEAAEGDHCG